MADNPRPDGKLLHFLNKLADRYLLFLTLVMITVLYAVVRIPELLQLLIMLVGAIIALSAKKQEPQLPTVDNSINADVIKTPQVKTDTMSGAVSTETITVKNDDLG